jgi:hypothetical protein
MAAFQSAELRGANVKDTITNCHHSKHSAAEAAPSGGILNVERIDGGKRWALVDTAAARLELPFRSAATGSDDAPRRVAECRTIGAN